MASLTYQKISNSYLGLLNTTSNGVLTSSLAQITDGNGNGSPIYLSTAALNLYNKYTFPDAVPASGSFLKAANGSGTLEWGADNNSDTLNTAGDGGTGTVTLSSQSLTIAGTTNQIQTTASTQSITLAFPSGGVTLPDGSVATTQSTSTASVNGAVTSSASVVLDGNSGTIVLGDRVTGSGIDGVVTVSNITDQNNITLSSVQTLSNDTVLTFRDNSTKVATTAYVEAAVAGAGTGNVNVSGTPTANQIAIWTDGTTIKGMSAIEIDSNNKITITQGTQNYYIGGGNLANNSGEGNVGLGNDVFKSQTSGNFNIGIGDFAFEDFITGGRNIGIGYASFANSTGTTSNVGVGASTLGYATADNNTAIGDSALGNASFTGTLNTALGYDSGKNITSGSKNVILGSNTGSTIATSSNNIIISDGDGNARIQVDSSGNVGIGITSPTSYNAAGDNLVVGSTSNNNNGITIVSPSGGSANDSRGNIYFADATNDTSGFITYKHRSDAEQMLIGVADSVALTISSTGASTFNTTGNNGIINIGGSTFYSQLETNAVLGGLKIKSIWGAANSGVIQFINGTSENVRMHITDGGNVGVGTTSPDGYYGKKLVVACPNEGGITITTEAENDDTKQYICFADNDDNFNGTLAGYISFDHATNQMSIGNDAGNDRILINTGGNVGVGVSPNQKFEVSSGAAQFNGGNIDGTFGDAILFGNTTFNTVQKNRIRSSISAAQVNNKLSFETSTGTTGAFNDSQFVLHGDNSASFSGSVSKGSGSFKIDHPLEDKKNTHHLVHSFVESPQANNIYRGNVNLENGTAQVNLDEVSTMTEGTFILLNTNIHCYTSNESDWDAVKGSVSGNKLTIECQNTNSTATISWMVVGERDDQHMKDTEWTHPDGKIIMEPEK